MTAESNSLILMIAADDPTQAAALGEMLHHIRPDLHIRSFSPRPTGEPNLGVEPDLAMVVEQLGEEIGSLSARVRAAHPHVNLVMIAPRFDERAIAAAARVDAAAIIPSPCESAALIRVIKLQQRKVRFPGRCGSVDTGELLRLHAAGSSNGVLHLGDGGRVGAIHLEDGQPVHAHCGELRGSEAVRELLRWRSVDATWIEGRSGSTRTIVGRIEGLLERDLDDDSADYVSVDEAPREVIERLDQIASIEDILGVYLLRNTEIVNGRSDSSLDDVLISRALTGLARVFMAMEDQQGERSGTEIQATVGEHRLVVDRLGPARLGFQIGVVVRQATPVCKSLRRLLRQLDRNFRRLLADRARVMGAGASTSSVDASGPVEAASFHRVA
jgi:Domain of unknown function (DUF4388)